MEWKLADAKNRFSEVINRALSEGPQMVSKRDATVVVVIALTDYEKLAGKKLTFKEYLMNGPGLEGLNLTRDKSLARAVDL